MKKIKIRICHVVLPKKLKLFINEICSIAAQSVTNDAMNEYDLTSSKCLKSVTQLIYIIISIYFVLDKH
jgi:hypothetical protein